MSNSIHYPQKIRKTGKKLIIGSFLAKFLPLKSQMLFFIIFVFRVWTDLNIPNVANFTFFPMVYITNVQLPPLSPKNPKNWRETENLVIFGQISNLKIAIVGNACKLESPKFHRNYPMSSSSLS